MTAERARAELDAALRGGRAVVLHAYPSRLVLEGVQALVGEVTQRGEYVVVLIDLPSGLHDPGRLEPWRPLLAGAYAAEPFHEGTAYLGTVSGFIDILRQSSHEPWVERVGLLLLPRGEDVLARPYVWELLAFTLRDRFAARRQAELPRTVVIVEPRRAPEPALREALPIYATGPHAARDVWTEYPAPAEPPESLWWTIWTSEDSRGYAAGLASVTAREFTGAVAPLAQFAGRWGVPAAANRVFSAPDSGDRDHFQNLQKAVGRLLFAPQPVAPWEWIDATAASTGVATLQDSQGNPWRSLHRVAAAFEGTTLCNIVSRSSLLLPYQLWNARAFAVHPLLPISPLVSLNRPFDTASQLVQRVDVAGSLDQEVVRNALLCTEHPCARDDPQLVDVYNCARRLVEAELGPAVADQLRWNEQYSWTGSEHDVRFGPTGSLSLVSGTIARAEVPWLDEFEVTEDAGTVYDVARREHVTQRYWTGKVVLLEGQKFVVNAIDQEICRVRISHDDRPELPEYRPQRCITLDEPARWRPTDPSRDLQMGNGARLRVESFLLDFRVATERVVVSLDHWTNPPYTEQLAVPVERSYRGGRVARLSLTQGEASLLTPAAAVALAAWLNEAAPTLLPEVAGFLAAAPSVPADGRPRADSVADRIVPTLTRDNRADPDPAVWIFEDSQSDLGIVRAVVNEAEYLLDLCFDWLSWTLDEAASPPPDRVCLLQDVSPPRDWFAFGMPERDAAIGLAELRDALRPFTGLFRVFTPERRNATCPPLLDRPERAQEVACDFCGTGISGGKPYDALADGRVSCKGCSEIGVARLEVLEQLFHAVAVPFFRDAHEVVDITNVRVGLVDQAQISDALSRHFIPTSEFDVRTTGLAVKGGGQARSATVLEAERHLILIESGFSPEATASVLVHELCHVWQYNHLDVAGMPERLRRLYFEGHAVWTQESFHNWVTGRKFAQFEPERWLPVIERNRARQASEDEYGQGYRLLKQHLSLLQNSAFEWLRRAYPRR